MNTRRILTIAGLAVAVAVGWGTGSSFAQGTVDASGRRDGNAIAAKRVTQAQREAAAERMKALKESLQPVSVEKSSTVPLKAPAAPLKAPPGPLKIPAAPGGAPDYFGVANWAFSPAIRKFIDKLPGVGVAGENLIGQYISVANPDTITYPGSDYYEISVREFSQKLHTDLDPTRLRGYVQTNKGTDAGGQNTINPDPIHYLGAMIVAQKNRPVRIKFTNELSTGTPGELFLPVDKSVMGAGMGPLGTEYTQNRAVLHLHGGKTPWISDGTPHQWITPAGENTSYPTGVSMQNVPDMPDPGAGSQTYYYTNQQSGRLLFYHDHSYGITRLNVYAGEVAGYLIQDPIEKDLVTRGIIPADVFPLIIQDKSFVDASTVRVTDPTWNWGTGAVDGNGVRPPVNGDLWYPHIYSPAQNPYDIGGANAFGRWHYGPWFWPPTTDVLYPPIPNPFYDPINAPWEPPEMPACPNPSMPGESFFDTALVNGTAFPTHTVEPRPYRFRILNGANDRFFNLQFYKADPAVASSDGRTLTEVKMVPAVPTIGFPATWPTDGREGGVPDPATAGPSWIQIGNEGGFLPAPAVIPSQPIVWNLDPTTFNFGNVSDHSLLLAPAERADVIVDFSAFAGQTLILYNDAPAAFPALDARYDYYTGAPDLSDTGGHTGPQIGFGPNIRTIMQIKVAAAPISSFNMTNLNNEFKSTPTYQGVFERGQNPIIVGQTAYNDTYAKTFPTAWPNWGYSRIQDTALGFETVTGVILNNPMAPKAIQDEMGEAYDKEYGRMSGKLGLELQNTSAVTQNFVLQSFVDPATEIVVDSITDGPPTLGDGTQLWKITHNGVDTHPIHFHLFDVQVINRVGWDGAIRLPDANELGWKETVRVSPLEDTIVALRATAPKLPFGIRESIRYLSPATPPGSPEGFANIDPYTGGDLVPPTTNILSNFGWEYVWHCHILSHEEMDMMRPIAFDVVVDLPSAPTDLTVTGVGTSAILNWTDPTPASDPATLGNPANEVGFRIERALGATGVFEMIGTAPANQTTFADPANPTGTTRYKVIAFNAAGVSPDSNIVTLNLSTTVPGAPTGATATAGNAQATVTFIPPASSGGSAITSYTVTSSPGGITAAGTASPITITGLSNGIPYTFTVSATNLLGTGAASAPSNAVTPAGVPGAPTAVTAVKGNAQATVSFNPPVPNGSPAITSYTVTSTPGGIIRTGTASPITVIGLTNGTSYTFQVAANNIFGAGPVSVASNDVIPSTVPGAPTIGAVTAGNTQVTVDLTPPASDGGSVITSYTVTSIPGGITKTGTTSPIIVTGLTNGTAYTFTATATSAIGTGPASAASTSATPGSVPGAPVMNGATAGYMQAVISFSPPASNGGKAITMYNVTANPGGLIVSKSSSPITVNGLAYGTNYTFTVTATNAYGTGSASSASSVAPLGLVPSAPRTVTAIAGNAQATVSFTPPANNGGAPITSYTVTSSPGSKIATGLTSPIVVTGLTNGTSYTFTVKATNAVGTGPASTRSLAVRPAALPGAPTVGKITAGIGQATVAFTAPVSNGGSPITSYTVTSNPGGFTAAKKTSPIIVTGLTGGTPYTFTVTATNALGTGAASAASGAVTPTAAVPGAPTAAKAVRGNAQATVSFTAPLANGSAITGYTVTSNPGGITVGGAASPIVVPGLKNGTSYRFNVKATNGVGTGAVSAYSAAVVPATVPAAPTIGTAVAGNGQATVSFIPVPLASNGGTAITSYTVTSAPGGLTASKTTSPIIVTGLTNGTAYTFSVTANNAVGTGAASASTTAVTPVTLPGAPTAVSAAAGNALATVSFTAPASNGGSAITSYTVTSSPGGKTATGAASPLVVNGLTNGTAYTFTVKATTSIGTGPASAASVKVTPATLPGAPKIGKAVRLSSTQVRVPFTAPTSNGGSVITSYTVTSNPGGITSTAKASPITVNGLTTGTPYTFTVNATNAIGTGAASVASNAVTP